MTDRPASAPMSCDEVRDLAPGFVLGALGPAEAASVREHLASCPEAHGEFAELGGVVPYLAESLEPMTPPTALRGRMLAAVAAEASGPSARPEPAAVTVSESGLPSAVSIERPGRAPMVTLDAERARRRSFVAWLAVAAVFLVVVGLGGWYVSTTQGLAGPEDYGAAVDRLRAAAAKPGGQLAVLGSAEAGGPSGVAAIGPDGTIEIAMRGLAPTAGTQVYEAWIIGPDKTPIPIGSFVPDQKGFGSLASPRGPTSPGVTIALTREPTAGPITPTLPVVSSGVAGSP